MADLIDVLKKVKPAVVAIAMARPPNKQGESGIRRVIGSGFNLDPKGLIVTCRHVLEGFLLDPPGFLGPPADLQPGELRGVPTEHIPAYPVFTFMEGDDLKLIHLPLSFTIFPYKYDVAVSRTAAPPFPLPMLELGSGEQIHEGTPVGVCGYPLGLVLEPGTEDTASSFQTGIVSAVLPHPGVRLHRRAMYRLDININPGNSGGPVFLQGNGRVVAILSERPLDLRPVVTTEGKPTNLLTRASSGMGHAIPIDGVSDYIERTRQLTDKEVENFREGRKPEWWGEM